MRVLSIDGGGIRGLIPAVVLAEIERRTGRRVADLFDLIAGTSTGGILACALARPGADGRPRYSAEELIDLYELEGPRIFSRSLLKRVSSVEGVLDERYDNAGLRQALVRYLGDAMLSDALVPVVLTAYEIEQRLAFFFRSRRASADPRYDFTLADAALATSSAPTYFEPVRVRDAASDASYALVDGGVFASNPAMCAYADLIGEGHRDEIRVLASLGTGEQIRPIAYERARGYGAIEWARPIIDVLLSSQAETAGFQLERILGERYLRLQARLDVACDDMDDASPENLRDLRTEADRLIRKADREIDALCATLTT